MSLNSILYTTNKVSSCKSHTTKAKTFRIRSSCDNELADVAHTLASEYWSTSSKSRVVDVRFCEQLELEDYNVENTEVIVCDNDVWYSDIVNGISVNRIFKSPPVEDEDSIKRLSDLSKAKRIATKFPLFKDLTDESDVIVPLENGEKMCVHYKDIRYVESFLFRMYRKLTNLQQRFKQCRTKPEFAYDSSVIHRLYSEERAIVMSLLSQRRCNNDILVTFLNMKLHQLSAFTFELIRRGESMNEVVEWNIGEYIDSAERYNIRGVVRFVAANFLRLGQFIYTKWKQQFAFVRATGDRLLDMCVDADAVSKRETTDSMIELHNKIGRELSAVACLLEPCDKHRVVNTMCKLVHLTQLYETAYTMTTPTLRMAIQRRIDVLILIITEHNMRAQNNALHFNRQFYRLAYENTILASELLQVNLFYERHEATASIVTRVT